MATVAIIPARSGSKRLPGKNTMRFNGKPMIAWSILAAFGTDRFDQIIVSTDDEEIAEVARQYGASIPFLRPSRLATDEASTVDVVLHVLETVVADTVAILQPTSPLRTSMDISACLDLHLRTAKPVVSMTPAKPWLYSTNSDGLLSEIAFGEELLTPNGAVYIANVSTLRETKNCFLGAVPYIMPPERSIDIDTQVDFNAALATVQSGAEEVGFDEAYAMAT